LGSVKVLDDHGELVIVVAIVRGVSGSHSGIEGSFGSVKGAASRRDQTDSDLEDVTGQPGLATGTACMKGMTLYNARTRRTRAGGAGSHDDRSVLKEGKEEPENHGTSEE